jgi:hypothetical protein
MSNERIKRLKERAKKTRAAAHERVVKDGTIQFRFDAENMDRLLRLADEKRTGAGVLARMWVLERLNQELANDVDTLSRSAFAAPLTSEEIQLMRAVSRNMVAQEVSSTKPWVEQLADLQKQMGFLSQLMQELISKQAKAR